VLQFPARTQSPKTLTAICVFARTSLLKGFFVRKKAKTQNAFNKRFGKKPEESRLNQILFCYFATVPADGLKFSR